MSPPNTERFLLDTGPLLDYLVLSYERAFPSTCDWLLGLVSSRVRNPPWRNVLIPFVEHLRGRLVTTPGVFAEVHHHVERCERHGARGRGAPPGDRRARFWNLTRERTAQLGIEERTLPLHEGAVEHLRRLGPVDMAMLALAAQAEGEHRRFVILTHDGPLVAEGAMVGVSVEHVDDRLQSFISESGAG